jgi:long-chain acyl-CoA synthetase
VLGRDVAVTLPLISGLIPHFGETPDELPAMLFETAPSVLFTVPRYLQKFASQVLLGILNSGGVKRAAADRALAFARGHARRRWHGDNGLLDQTLYSACRAGVFVPILNKLGFDRLELVICAGAPLPPETMALWQMLGVNLVEMYGQTETAGGIVTGQRGPFPRPGDVGTVPEGWEVKLAGDGEVLVRSPDLYDRYWNNAEATCAVKGADGWLHTGDVGEWRDGALRLIDRARDFIVTSGGKTVSPSSIESILRASPYVAEAVVIGHGRKYLTALIEIDADTVADWARSHDVAYTGYTSLACSRDVIGLIKAEIERANGELARVEQIKDFRILPKALDPEQDDEPVTPTRKVKRQLMHERFKALVEDMYDDREQRLIAEGAGGMPVS